MSFSYAYIAVTTDVGTLQAAVLDAWPAIELAEPAREFSTWAEAYAWAGPRSGYLSGRHPENVVLLFADHSWAVMADFSMCLDTDDSALSLLSRQFGRVVAASTQGTAGVAQLRVFDSGTRVRELMGESGKVSVSGTPLPEEAGIDLDAFSRDALDAIWCRLGLSSFLRSEPAGPFVAMHVLDRTEFPPVASPSRKVEKRPWWKLW